MSEDNKKSVNEKIKVSVPTPQPKTDTPSTTINESVEYNSVNYKRDQTIQKVKFDDTKPPKKGK